MLSKKWIVSIPIIIFLSFLDQLTKYAIAHNLKNNLIIVIQNFFHIVYIENTGITFGLLRDLPIALKKPILIFLPVIIMGLILYILYKTKEEEISTHIALSFIISGAIGNIIDRIRLNYVIDFLYFNLYFFWWPAFNVADACVVVGMV
jgi:signal peptidase II